MLKIFPDPAESGTAQRQSVIVIYESAAAHERAMYFCGRLARKSDATPQVHWHGFESLRNNATATELINKAARADLLVFSFSSQGDFPQELKLWIERWLGKRCEREGSLVGLVTDRVQSVCPFASLKEIYLRHIALRAGMDYLSHVPPSAEKVIPDSLDSFTRRAGQMTSVLGKILESQPAIAAPKL
jgi:hypothetical protein